MCNNLWVLMLASVPLAACMQPQPQPQLPPTAADMAPSTAPEAIEGEYRVAGIDGQEVSGGLAIALTVTDQEIWFQPRCAGFSWTYSYSEGALTTDRPEKRGADRRTSDGMIVAQRMRPVCRIAVHPEQTRLAEALDGVTQVRRLPSNAIEFFGEERSVTLFTQ